MLLIELLHSATKELTGFSESPRLDAELLLCEVLGVSKIDLLLRSNEEVDAGAEARLSGFVERRLAGEPIAYILGRKEFYGLEFQVSSACLVPRPETELLVEKALEYASGFGSALKLLDLGTGSGCIAVALSHELQKARREFEIVAVDKSSEALDMAEKNARNHGLRDKITFLNSDWFSALKREQFDLILANPPYIAGADTQVGRELKFEPESALYAEENGLAEIRAILTALPLHLHQGGRFLCEIGATQSEQVLELANQVLGGRYEARIWNDLAGLSRLLDLHKN